MKLAIPLSEKQVAAANRLHDQLSQWKLADKALKLLHTSCPGFSRESVLIKAVAVNTLYGTNVIAINRVADHVYTTIGRVALAKAGPRLVEKIARVPVGSTETKQICRRSFAAKFAHFFIDSETFPIFDAYAESMVRYHLGRRNARRDGDARYEAYVENFHRLRELARLRGPKRDLDHYLWIAGQYGKFQRNTNARINMELRMLFKSQPADLKLLLPPLPPLPGS